MTYGKLRSCRYVQRYVIANQNGIRLPRPRRFQTGEAVEKTKETTAVRTRPGITGYGGGHGQQGLVIRVSRWGDLSTGQDEPGLKACVHIGLIRDCVEPGTDYRVMCLGLGSLSELENARFQLVFLRLVLQNVLGVVSVIRKACEVILILILNELRRLTIA